MTRNERFFGRRAHIAKRPDSRVPPPDPSAGRLQSTPAEDRRQTDCRNLPGIVLNPIQYGRRHFLGRFHSAFAGIMDFIEACIKRPGRMPFRERTDQYRL